MTKEELKQEAEEYANKNVPVDTFGYRRLNDVHCDVKQAYLAAAEPRENEIISLNTQLDDSENQRIFWKEQCFAR